MSTQPYFQNKEINRHVFLYIIVFKKILRVSWIWNINIVIMSKSGTQLNGRVADINIGKIFSSRCS